MSDGNKFFSRAKYSHNRHLADNQIISGNISNSYYKQYIIRKVDYSLILAARRSDREPRSQVTTVIIEM